MDASLKQTAARLPFLAALAPDDLERLLGDAAVRALDDGAALYRAGAPADTLYLLLAGRLALGAGEVMEAGDLVGADALCADARYAETALAHGPVRVLAVPAAALRAHLEERFEAVLALLAGASAGLRGMIHAITELKLRSTTHRLANYLIGLAGPETADGVARIVLPCEKSQLAERLGMQPESLSRAFAKLRAHGVHSGRTGAVVLKDVAALRALCAGPDAEPGTDGGGEMWP